MQYCNAMQRRSGSWRTVKAPLLLVLTRRAREFPVMHTRLSPDLVARPFGVHNCALCLETLAGPPGDQTGVALVSVICALNVCGFCFWLLDCLDVL
jgi:hypothetical protein